MLERLYPDRGATTPAELVSGLDLASRASADRPYLVLNMVSTLDGKATLEWRTEGISSETDRELFHQLRSRVDAVMVGAGTARTERYGRMVKRDDLREQRHAAGLDPDPLAVVVSATLDLPADLPLLQEPEERVLVATGSDARIEGFGAQL